MMQKLLRLSGKLGPLFALVLLIVVFSLWDLYQSYEYGKTLRFLSFSNFGNVIAQTSVVAIAAIGMTFIIVSAGIDFGWITDRTFRCVCRLYGFMDGRYTADFCAYSSQYRNRHYHGKRRGIY